MPIDCQVVVVGAGPCGLFQIFELGLLGIECHVVDSLPHPGGQCATLYPEKPIYDIPALPVVGAQELVDRLLTQVKPFEPVFHFGEQATTLERRDDGRFRLLTSAGTEFHCAAVVIAAGLGAFQPRPLRLPGVERHEGVNLAYSVTGRARYAGRHVVILGGGDSALDWALALADSAASVTVVHRREEFRAQPASVARLRERAAAEPARVRIAVARVTAFAEDASGRLAALTLQPFAAGAPAETLALDELLVFYGLAPDLGPISGWGLDGDRRHLFVDTEHYQTSLPGVFAIGDINTYPGKKKLILSGFHEGALAAYAVQKHLDPKVRQHVQYTTTSPVLQARLGVSGALEP